MAFTSFKNCTRKQYEDEIYGQDYQHKIKITFDGTELENADKYCEKFTVKPRIIPNGSKSFSLNNFFPIKYINKTIEDVIIQLTIFKKITLLNIFNKKD